MSSDFQTRYFIKEINEYIRIKPKKKAALNIVECNNTFLTSDTYLRGIIQSMRTNKTISYYGVNMVKFSTAPSGILDKRCCTCPNKPISYVLKNQYRIEANNFINAWKKEAEKNVTDTFVAKKQSKGIKIKSKKVM